MERLDTRAPSAAEDDAPAPPGGLDGHRAAPGTARYSPVAARALRTARRRPGG